MTHEMRKEGREEKGKEKKRKEKREKEKKREKKKRRREKKRKETRLRREAPADLPEGQRTTDNRYRVVFFFCFKTSHPTPPKYGANTLPVK